MEAFQAAAEVRGSPSTTSRPFPTDADVKHPFMRIHFPNSLNNENENLVNNPPISTGYARPPARARPVFARRYKLAQEVGAKKNLNIQKYECVFHRHDYKVVISRFRT